VRLVLCRTGNAASWSASCACGSSSADSCIDTACCSSNGIDQRISNGTDQRISNSIDQRIRNGIDHRISNGTDQRISNGRDHRSSNAQGSDRTKGGSWGEFWGAPGYRARAWVQGDASSLKGVARSLWARLRGRRVGGERQNCAEVQEFGDEGVGVRVWCSDGSVEEEGVGEPLLLQDQQQLGRQHAFQQQQQQQQCLEHPKLRLLLSSLDLQLLPGQRLLVVCVGFHVFRHMFHRN